MTEDNLHTTCTNYFRNSTLTRQQIIDLIRPEEPRGRNSKLIKVVSVVAIFFCIVYTIGIVQCICWVIKKRRKAALERSLAGTNDADSQKVAEEKNDSSSRLLIDSVKENMAQN